MIKLTIQTYNIVLRHLILRWVIVLWLGPALPDDQQSPKLIRDWPSEMMGSLRPCSLSVREPQRNRHRRVREHFISTQSFRPGQIWIRYYCGLLAYGLSLWVSTIALYTCQTAENLEGWSDQSSLTNTHRVCAFDKIVTSARSDQSSHIVHIN